MTHLVVLLLRLHLRLCLHLCCCTSPDPASRTTHSSLQSQREECLKHALRELLGRRRKVTEGSGAQGGTSRLPANTPIGGRLTRGSAPLMCRRGAGTTAWLARCVCFSGCQQAVPLARVLVTCIIVCSK